MQSNWTDPTAYPGFNRAVPNGGYCWWYIDGISDDQKNQLTIIAFVGSVFSPYYKRARRRGPPAPQNYCALNVVHYGTQNRWCMTERPAQSTRTSANTFTIGPSALRYTPRSATTGTLHIDINEVTVPIPRRLRGSVSIDVSLQPEHFHLHPNRSHVWWPAAPASVISVDLEHPEQRWSGHAYVDMNWGDRALEDDIDYWCWSQQSTAEGAIIHYDVHTRGTGKQSVPDVSHALLLDRAGHLKPIDSTLDYTTLKKTRWLVPRHTRCDNKSPSLIKTLLDTPFYSRSMLTSQRHNQLANGIHESVSLTRFRHPLVQAMLHFRMPRKHHKPVP